MSIIFRPQLEIGRFKGLKVTICSEDNLTEAEEFYKKCKEFKDNYEKSNPRL